MMGEEEDFEARERQAAEDRAYEENPYGTGLDPDADQDYNYDYEDSGEANDVDFRPAGDFSDEFTGNNSTDDYTDQFGNDDEDDEEAGEDEDDDEEDEDDEDEIENYDGEDEEDGDEDEEETEDEVGESEQKQEGEVEQDGKQGDKKGKKSKDKQSKNGKKEYPKAKINWAPGEPITLALLSQVWEDCHKIKEVTPLIQSANAAVGAALNFESPGSNLSMYIRVYDQFLQWFGRRSDLIGTMLKLATSFGPRTIATVAAVVQAFGSQMWADPMAIAILPTAVDALLGKQPFKGIINKIFEIAVPILEAMEANKNGVAKYNAVALDLQ